MHVRSFLADLARRRGLLIWLLAAAVGCAVFLWIGYARTLDPRDLTWMWHEDPFTHTMGWEQFRNAPLLQYPISKNELYGLEWSSTIVFTDSIPIAALLLRPFSALLPHPFQYLGWWVLLSLVLQAYWGARLVQLRSDRFRDMAIGSMLFATSPVLMERLGLQSGVGSHWLLLWALWLYLSARAANTRAWMILLLLSVSIHAYLFVMVGAIWAAHLVDCQLRGLLSRRDLAATGVVFVAVMLWMHALGYFLVGSGAAAGAWRASFDLVGFVAPSTGARFGLIAPRYNDPWDGSAYLGAGMLVLLVLSIVAYAIRRRAIRERPVVERTFRWSPLLVVVIALVAFAITNQVKFAGEEAVTFEIPHAVTSLYETFRGAGRMVWPAYYLLLMAGMWLALSAWPARVVGWILAATLLLQLADLHGIATLKRTELASGGMTKPLRDPIWRTIAHHHRRIVSVPAYHRLANWPTFAWFAARHSLGSNIGYLSRSNVARRNAGTELNLRAVADGTYDPDTVYYFPSPVLWEVARATIGPQDLALVADGFHLVVPLARMLGHESLQPAPEVPMLGKWIAFSDPAHGGLLVDGWRWQEPWGVWAVNATSRLLLPVPPDTRVRVTLSYLLGPGKNEPRTATFRIRLGTEVFEAPARTGVERSSSFEVTTTSRLLHVRIEGSRFGLVAARVQLASDPAEEPPIAATTQPVLDSWLGFAHGDRGRDFLQRGWAGGESWGSWTADRVATLSLPVPPGQHVSISFRWLAAARPGKAQPVRVTVDGHPFDVKFPPNSQEIESSFDVVTTRRWADIVITVYEPFEAADGRALGVALKNARIKF